MNAYGDFMNLRDESVSVVSAIAKKARGKDSGLPNLTPHFDFTDLRLLCCFASTQSLTMAAEQACLSLPAASMRVKQLERDVGVTLIHRNGRNGSLTPAGEVFVKHAREVLQAAHRMMGSLDQIAKGERGKVVVWANTTALREYLPKDLLNFLIAYPEIDVELREHSTTEILHAVRTRLADVGVISRWYETPGLVTAPYRNEQLVVCVNRGHPLANKAEASFTDCLTYDFVGLNANNPFQSFSLERAAAFGSPIRLRIEVGSFADLEALIREGVGIAVMPETIAQTFAPTLGYVRLTDEWALQTIHICWADTHEASPTAQEFINYFGQLSLEAGRAR